MDKGHYSRLRVAGDAQMGDQVKGFVEAEHVAKLTTVTQLGIGLVELLVGQITTSISLTADGIDSLSDSTITLIVWFGLKLSRKAPDGRFHFGYLKVESLAALVASSAMIAVAITILYQSYLRLLEPQEISYPVIALVTLIGAGVLALYRALQMRRAARRSNLVSLKVGALNSLKDTSGSFTAFAAVLASVMGIPQVDAIGGMVIAGYICSVAYVSIKESSLVLVDACHRPELVEEIKGIVEGKHAAEVREVRLRRTGSYVVGFLDITVDGNLRMREVDEMVRRIELDVKNEIEGLGRLIISAHSR
ncbi:MAG: cation transporter [Thaumarchaeota archaeon]|nr:cation transporter [Nitrososphaerota archaeon]